jgi:hypothetical protein
MPLYTYRCLRAAHSTLHHITQLNLLDLLRHCFTLTRLRPHTHTPTQTMTDSTNANQPQQAEQKKGFFGTAASGLGMFLPPTLPSILPIPPFLTDRNKKATHSAPRRRP